MDKLQAESNSRHLDEGGGVHGSSCLRLDPDEENKFARVGSAGKCCVQINGKAGVEDGKLSPNQVPRGGETGPCPRESRRNAWDHSSKCRTVAKRMLQLAEVSVIRLVSV